MGEIRVDENPVSVTFPSKVRWNENGEVTNNGSNLTLKEKNSYLFSIVNNIGIISNIPNTSLDKPVLTLSDNILSWKPIKNADEYIVKTGYDYSGLTATVLTTTTATELNLDNYFSSAGSNSIFVIASSKYYTDSRSDSLVYIITEQLATPTNLVLSDTGILSWDAVENATSYELYRDSSLLTTITDNYIDLKSGGYSSGTINIVAINSSSSVYTPSDMSASISWVGA
jgi:hypothetical protein